MYKTAHPKQFFMVMGSEKEKKRKEKERKGKKRKGWMFATIGTNVGRSCRMDTFLLKEI